MIMITANLVAEKTISALRGGTDDFIGSQMRADEFNFAQARGPQAQQRGSFSSLRHAPQVLVIADDQHQAKPLLAALAQLEVRITCLHLTAEVADAPLIKGRFDLIVLDVGPEWLEPLLKQIRGDAKGAEIPVLVATNRVTEVVGLAGVMPKYRAMPCTPNEILRLAKHRFTRIARQLQASSSRLML
jgi:DNA-binding NtrC family response regulator